LNLKWINLTSVIQTVREILSKKADISKIDELMLLPEQKEKIKKYLLQLKPDLEESRAA
jgi:hypothetical protein